MTSPQPTLEVVHQASPVPDPAPRRRLSVPRLLLALAGIAAMGAGGMKGVAIFRADRSLPPPLVAPYVDATLTPLFPFEDQAALPAQTVVLGFVVADPTSPCSPSWGGYHTLDDARTALDIDRRIARFRQRGGDVLVSFGGAANTELAVGCSDQTSLEGAYRSVIDRYRPATIDLDLEGTALADGDALARRARALKAIQRQRKTSGTPLGIWLTLPVSPSGLSPEAVHAVDVMLYEGVDLAGVNLMTMNYGTSRDSSQSLLEASEAALDATHRQVADLWRRAGVELQGDQVWARIGATPMIGQNDAAGDHFSLADARALESFAAGNHLGRLSMWSLNRDKACGGNIDPQHVSDYCSGVDQKALDFNAVFAKLPGRPVGTATASPAPQAVRRSPSSFDDPATSPYPIWREDKSYQKGDEVVWRRNVYEAKWWSQGDQPDAPVAQAWDTPWRLVGPVLPGDRPKAEPPALPAGTYPDWSDTQAYEKGQRVLRNGHPYEAKWWTQGDVPGADVANDWDTPWRTVAGAKT
jgi:chitinase